MNWQEDLDAAIQDAFNLDDFKKLCTYRLKRNANELEGLAYDAARFKVISLAESEGWIRKLVQAAIVTKPGNPKLRIFRQSYPAVAPSFLKDTEITTLEAGLSSAFRTYEDLQAMLNLNLRVNLDEVVERGAGLVPEDYLQRVIRWYDERGITQEFIEAAIETRDPVMASKGKQVLAALRSREAAAGYSLPEPVETCLINQRVFINRRLLRGALKSLSPNPRKPIVGINGPDRSGKSYSLELIRHVASRQRGVEVASIDLKEEQHARFRPDALARSIMLQMARPQQLQYMPREQDAGSAARWARDLCDWLMGEARTSEKMWIIALDGFFHPDLPGETRDMVRELVKRAAAPGSPLRVILMHYSDDLLPPDVRSRVEPESLQPVTRKDLCEFLTSLAQQNGIAIEDGVIDELVDDIMAKVPTGEISDIADEVQLLVDELMAQQPVGGLP